MTNFIVTAQLAKIDGGKNMYYMVKDHTEMPPNANKKDILHMDWKMTKPKPKKNGTIPAPVPKATSHSGLFFRNLRPQEQFKILRQITACVLNIIYRKSRRPTPSKLDSPLYRADQNLYNKVRKRVLEKINESPDIIKIVRDDKGHGAIRGQFTIGLRPQVRGNYCDYYDKLFGDIATKLGL